MKGKMENTFVARADLQSVCTQIIEFVTRTLGVVSSYKLGYWKRHGLQIRAGGVSLCAGSVCVRTGIVSILALITPTLHAQSDSLSLNEIIEEAKIHALPGYAAIVDWERANWAFKSFQSQYKPQVSAFGTLPNFTSTFSPITQPDGSIEFQAIQYDNSNLGLSLTQRFAPTGAVFYAQTALQRYRENANDITNYNGTPLRVGFQQPISPFNPFKWQRLIEPIRLLEAQKQFVFDTEAVAVEALDFFFSLLIAQIDLQIAQSNQSSNQTLFELAEERFELGKISENDLLQLQLELIRSQKDEQDARQAVLVASTALQAYLGKPLNADSLMAVRIPDLQTFQSVNIAEALNHALANRPEIEGYKRRRLEAARSVKAAKAENRFDASLDASFGLSKGAMTLEEVYRNPQQAQNISLRFNIPILDWGRGKSEIKQAQLLQKLEQESIDREALSLDMEVRQVGMNFNQVQKTGKLAFEAQEIARKQFEISRNRYLMGDISITDLTLSLRAKDQARRAYILTLREFWRAYHRLRLLTLYDFETGNRIELEIKK